MLLIIEGPDKTGKTTLAKKIMTNTYGFTYKHFGIPGKNWYDEYVNFLLNARGMIICDRSPIGQFIYGPLFRKEKNDPEKIWNIFQIIRRLKCFIIYTKTSEHNINERILKEGDDFVSVKDTKKIITAYDDFFKKYPFDIHEYDYSTDNLFEGPESLSKQISDWMENTYADGYLFKYLGPQNPKILCIGERLNKKRKRLRNALPFDFGISSRLLKQTIPISADVGFINAFEEKTTLIKKIKKIKPATIIAFGEKVQKECKKYNIPYEALEHPAYIARFPDNKKHISTKEWQKKLLKIVK